MIELEHVGIAVGDAGSALAMIRHVLCEGPYKSEVVAEDAVRTHFIQAGPAKLELLEALDSDSPIARFLNRRGEGLHHLAFEVSDIQVTYDRLLHAGFRILDDAPRPGADGKVVFFVHPHDTGGVLFEFCSRRRSTLEDTTIIVGSDHIPIRRAGSPANPPLLIAEGGDLDGELLAERLEQIGYVTVVREEILVDGLELLDAAGLDRVHVAATSRGLARLNLPDERVRSLIIYVDADSDAIPIRDDILFVATPPGAAAAAGLWTRAATADMVVGDHQLIALAVEKHIRNREQPGPQSFSTASSSRSTASSSSEP